MTTITHHAHHGLSGGWRSVFATALLALSLGVHAADPTPAEPADAHAAEIRTAMEAARKWRFNPSVVNGQKAAGRVRVPVDFNMG